MNRIFRYDCLWFFFCTIAIFGGMDLQFHFRTVPRRNSSVSTLENLRPELRLSRQRPKTFPERVRPSAPIYWNLTPCFLFSPCYACWALISFFRSTTMEWTTPQHEEIDLNCEVSSYANAEL